MLGTLSLPAAGLLYFARHLTMDLLAAVVQPVVDTAVAAVHHPWSKQDVLELLTMCSTLAVLWKLSSGFVRKKTFRMQCPHITFDDVIGVRFSQDHSQTLLLARPWLCTRRPWAGLPGAPTIPSHPYGIAFAERRPTPLPLAHDSRSGDAGHCATADGGLHCDVLVCMHLKRANPCAIHVPSCSATEMGP